MTWAKKSHLLRRSMYVKKCEDCGREYFQVPEECFCRICSGVTWPIGYMPGLLTFAIKSGEPCLDTVNVRPKSADERLQEMRSIASEGANLL